jgi:hypothetical protein
MNPPTEHTVVEALATYRSMNAMFPEMNATTEPSAYLTSRAWSGLRVTFIHNGCLLRRAETAGQSRAHSGRCANLSASADGRPLGRSSNIERQS